MQPVIERCCGLDVHQATVVACVVVAPPGAQPTKQTRTFSTFTRDLLTLRDWLEGQQVTHVAMESTGVYWKPVHAVLEDRFDVVVANAQHIKQVPGRKTDVKDSEWLAQLLRHGLLRASFIPPKAIRELRDLLRYRRKLVEGRTAERNRLLKLLETANIKLASVVSDVFGASGRAMLAALLAGKSSLLTMAQLAKGRLRSKLAELELALDGRLEEHHRFILGVQLKRLDRADEDVALLDEQIEQRLMPYREQRERLMQIPGVSYITAAVMVAEMGVDMAVFQSAHHLASWAGMCPGNNESAGKRMSGQIRKGNVTLKTALVEAAQAAARTKGTYLKDKFYRLRARRGHKRAVVAIGHKILVSAYFMLRDQLDYKDLGDTYLDELDRTRTVQALTRRIERLGFEVTLAERNESA